MQRAPSLSSKNFMPNWLANSGMYSIIASLTLQCRSSASSTIAGNRDWESRSIPITCIHSSHHVKRDQHSIIPQAQEENMEWFETRKSLQVFTWSFLILHVIVQTNKWEDWSVYEPPDTWLTWSSLLIMFSRTSGNSSFRRERKIGNRCSIVASCST